MTWKMTNEWQNKRWCWDDNDDGKRGGCRSKWWPFSCVPSLSFFLSLSPGSSYSKRGGQGDNRTAAEDSGRKGSSGSSTTKVPASPLVSSDRKKSATPSTVRPNTHTAYLTFVTLTCHTRRFTYTAVFLFIWPLQRTLALPCHTLLVNID